jgi:hypothetical protein
MARGVEGFEVDVIAVAVPDRMQRDREVAITPCARYSVSNRARESINRLGVRPGPGNYIRL